MAVQAIAGLAAMVVATLVLRDEPQRVLSGIGEDAPLLIVTLFAFASILALMRFKLTKDIFVSPAVNAYIVLIPLLGLVLSMWIAVLVASSTRLLALLGVGPTKITPDDTRLEFARLSALAGIYGIPMIVANLAYQFWGGSAPLADSTLTSAARICGAGLVLMAVNILVLSPSWKPLGYSRRTMIRMSVIDVSIYVIGLPYSVLVAYCWVALGFKGLLLAIFVGIVGVAVVRRLASASTANDKLVRRLASISNIASAISLDLQAEELLATMHSECAKVVDASLFSVALVDEDSRVLRFVYEARDGERMPPTVVSFGDGLNSWVVEHRKPLLLNSARQQAALGLESFDDGLSTESWLGVPMIVRDRLVGVISIQNRAPHAFTNDDLVVLTAVAIHAAAAIEGSRLFRQMEGINLDLERRIDERTAELRELNLRLTAADQAKSRFLANTSHELRTPLNSIIGFSQILAEQTRESLPPRLHGFLLNILHSSTHLLALINDILDLSKIEAGRLELDPAPFDIRETLASVERVMKGVAADAGVSIHIELDSRLGEVEMEEGRIKQVLINLLSNAVKYSERGGTIQLIISRVDESVSPLGCDTVRITVEDKGEGMTPDVQARVFEEFYQAESSSKRRVGTGLGLPLTLRFVELHGGTIRVLSHPGQGSTFTVDLPERAEVHLTNLRPFQHRARSRG